MTQEDKRSEPRIEVTNGIAEIDGKQYPLRNWSSRGFLVGDYDGGRKAADVIDIKFSVPFVGMSIEFTGKGRVLRILEETKELAGLLVEMDAEWANPTLARYFGADWDENEDL